MMKVRSCSTPITGSEKNDISKEWGIDPNYMRSLHFGGLLTDPSFQQAPGLDRLSHTRKDQSKIQTYSGFQRIGVQEICWPTLQGQLRMGSYESLSTMDSLQAWTQPGPLSSLDTSVDLVYLACGAYGSSLHLERHHSQHHRPLHIHCLQGLLP